MKILITFLFIVTTLSTSVFANRTSRIRNKTRDHVSDLPKQPVEKISNPRNTSLGSSRRSFMEPEDTGRGHVGFDIITYNFKVSNNDIKVQINSEDNLSVDVTSSGNLTSKQLKVLKADINKVIRANPSASESKLESLIKDKINSYLDMADILEK